MALPFKRKRDDFLRGIIVKMPGVNVEEIDRKGKYTGGKS